jgi:phosphatidate cytidylyltransferase
MDHRPPRERLEQQPEGVRSDDSPTEAVRVLAGAPAPQPDEGGWEQPATEPDPAVPSTRRSSAAGRSRRRPARTGAGGSASLRPRGSADRNLPLAIGVGVALAAAALILLNIGPAYGVAFATVIVTLCAGELFGALRKARFQPATLLGLVAVPGLVLAAYWRGEVALPLVLALTTAFTLLWFLVGVSRKEPTLNAGLTLLTVAYVGLFGSYAALMLRLPDGTGLLLGTAVAVVANDVGALFAGRRFGRSPIAADISPNKTIEGALGGAVASIVVSFVVLDLIGLHPWDAKGGSALALGALVAVLAPIGDLVESMLKRDLDVKDMGSILPGHGGLIDRFDAVLFVLPAAYYLIRLLEIA